MYFYQQMKSVIAVYHCCITLFGKHLIVIELLLIRVKRRGINTVVFKAQDWNIPLKVRRYLRTYHQQEGHVFNHRLSIIYIISYRSCSSRRDVFGLR